MIMAPTTPLPTHPARVAIALLATLLLGLALPSTASALAGSDLDVEVLVDGSALREYPARGTTYVEALEGAEYSLRLRNRTGHRLAVALAVDGLNSIDARSTTARAAAKWVLDPWGEMTVTGWQTNERAARRFVFTTETDSYGAWLGRTEQLGVIEAVVFRERPVPQPYAGKLQGPAREQAGESRQAPAPRLKNEAESAAGELSDRHAATGIGREVDNPVRRVRLDLEDRPSTTIRIRYEYRPQLVALGVLPRPAIGGALERREQAHGFLDGAFCPDPYRARR
jgi:hypothetical protein